LDKKWMLHKHRERLVTDVTWKSQINNIVGPLQLLQKVANAGSQNIFLT